MYKPLPADDKGMNDFIHNTDFDVFNDGFENDNYLDFDDEKIIEDFEENTLTCIDDQLYI